MSEPKALQAEPARFNFAVNPIEVVCTELREYPVEFKFITVHLMNKIK